MRLWKNLHQVHSKSEDWKTKSLKVLGAIKPRAYTG